MFFPYQVNTLCQFTVTAYRILHLLRRSLTLTCQALEVQEVRLRALRLVSAAPCKQLQENLHGLIEKLQFAGIVPFIAWMKSYFSGAFPVCLHHWKKAEARWLFETGYAENPAVNIRPPP